MIYSALVHDYCKMALDSLKLTVFLSGVDSAYARVALDLCQIALDSYKILIHKMSEEKNKKED